jgi:cysteinyl-tRNA synthetase
MDDNLNTSVALAAYGRFVTEVNARLDELGARAITEAERDAALDVFRRIDGVFMFVELADREAAGAVDGELAAWVEERIAARRAARASKDFAAADAIRDELAARGVVVEDTPQGPRWRAGA